MKLCVFILCSISVVWADDASSTRIREAATKAVALIQKSQKSWPSKQSCYSCHQQVLPALAFRAAREHGIPVDEPAAHADAAYAFAFYSNLDRAVQYTHIIDPAMDDGYGLMAADAAGLRPSLVTAVYARLLAVRQEADGHWETGDERPPESYGPFTATAISMAAIQRHGLELRDHRRHRNHHRRYRGNRLDWRRSQGHRHAQSGYHKGASVSGSQHVHRHGKI